MSNIYIPFPQYENAVFCGDKAAEILGALRIYSRALIGGEVPSMELLHPAEKPLECISCLLGAPERILKSALRRMAADYVLLEDNGKENFNPAVLKDTIESFGYPVRVLDVKGSADEILRRAGILYGAEKQAERVIRDRKERTERLKGLGIPRGRRLVILLGIRNPVRNESYCFRVAAHSELSQLLEENFGAVNLFEGSPENDLITGIQELSRIEELFEMDPDLICCTGDALASMTRMRNAFTRTTEAQSQCRAMREGRIAALPYYCDALSWRAPVILEEWAEALSWE